MSRKSAELVTESHLADALRLLVEIVQDDPTYRSLLDCVGSELLAMRAKRQQIEQLLAQIEPPTLELRANPTPPSAA